MKAVTMQMRRRAKALVRLCLIPCCLPTLSVVPVSAAEMVREERGVHGFHTVVLMTAGDLQVTQGDRESLIVEADAGVIANIVSVVRNGVLYIEGNATPIVTQLPIRFTLSVRELRALRAFATGAVLLKGIRGQTLSIDASGSSNIDGSHLDLGDLRLASSGSGNVSLQGRAKRQEARISGAGSYSAAQLVSQQATISLSGAGNASVNASQTLDVEISGSGDVSYSADPVLEQRITGAGSLRRASH